ncbi:MAG: hypothetical protein DRN01_01705 [Thermoplasmata archaeon]|nr:MAG: hypothetical protein FE035_00645 [Thermoplasmata archaeon]RLF27717.1 MAG: hypothetical protein DRN01_01705 [Thermoplasmata archaeon]
MVDKPVLFSLENCERCEFVKGRIPEGVDVEIKTYPHELKDWTVDQITEAAFHEVYAELQRTAPILLLPDGSKLTGAIEIKNFLSSMKKD